MQQKLEAACATSVADMCPQAAHDPDEVKACLLQHRERVAAECLRLLDASE